MGFSHFQLSSELFQSITALGYAEPTPVQAKVIPEALKGHDIQACAQTGTGKTCAFVLPVLEKLLKAPRAHSSRVLILTPTRELAAQVIAVVQDLAKHTRIKTALILGGASFNYQTKQIRAGAEIIVATPGRLLDHIKQGTVSLRDVHTFVLDEADRMLDMGFIPAIRSIVAALPLKRQTMLFSATYSHEIQRLIQQFLKNPVVIELAKSVPSQNVTQMIYPVSRGQKVALLQAILELGNMTSALVFTRTKHGANHLAETLHRLGKSVTVMHGNRSQSQRQAALLGFKEKRFQILVATDIAARGIDVKDISHVINFDVPVSPEDYVHRIGRTGRAQAVGEAFTLVAPDEESDIRSIERLIGKTIPRGVIPDFPYQSSPKVFKSSGQNHRSHHGGKAHNRKPFPPRPSSPYARPNQGGAPTHGSGGRPFQSSRPYSGNRSEGNRPQSDRPQGTGNQFPPRKPYQGGGRPFSSGRPNNNRPQGDRPQGSGNSFPPRRPNSDSFPPRRPDHKKKDF